MLAIKRRTFAESGTPEPGDVLVIRQSDGSVECLTAVEVTERESMPWEPRKFTVECEVSSERNQS